MVAYSFQPRFIDPIVAGIKRRTVRRLGRKRHARPGEPMQLYTGLRTRAARKLVPDPVCVGADHILLSIEGGPNPAITEMAINGVPLAFEEMAAFARQDGFADLADMARFWLKMHGAGPFEGVVLAWQPQIDAAP